MTARSLLLLVFGFCTAKADVYDFLLGAWTHDPDTCFDGCASWDAIQESKYQNQSSIDKTWYHGKPPSDAGNKCAMPGGSAGQFECDGCTVDSVVNSYAGPWCYCKTPATGHNNTQYCIPPMEVPEQLNLQVADATSVVASFVTRGKTYEKEREACSAMFGQTEESMQLVPGISHHYKHLSKGEGMSYTLHFIKLAGLEPGKNYVYKVKSHASEWSPVYTFRGIDLTLPKFAIYGDMGHTKHGPMGNLEEECTSGKIDFIVHMGDHAYDLGGANDKRGDAYMNVFSRVLASCPWIPIIGNHEVNDGDHYQRYLNMTWGQTLVETKSTAVSALGDFLTKATLFGPGFHAAVPSKTSRYFSVDLGAIHIVGLDLNRLDDGQLSWLEEDLKKVNRETTPWILVSSHFPLFHPSVAENMGASNDFYSGDGHEKYATSGHDFVPVECDALGKCKETVGEALLRNQQALLPVLEKFGVDIYDAGHVHDYAATWPICRIGSVSGICKDEHSKPIKNYKNPKGTVHIVEGNGGVPGVLGVNDLKPCAPKEPDWCRVHGHGGNHGIISILSPEILKYEHVENPTGKVTDVMTIIQNRHGPFI